jgi:Tol biopolymer transport system component
MLRQQIPLRLLAVMVACAAGRACRSQPTPAASDNGSWWIQVSTADKSYRVRPDGSEWTEVPHIKHRAGLSPDGKRVVYASVPEADKRVSYSEIFVADLDGKNVKRLTDNDAQDTYPNWAPDGNRIIFVSDRGGSWQVFAMDPVGANVEPLTKEAVGAQTPKLAPDGKLAYLALRKRQGKVWFQDLIVRDGATSRAIAKDSWLYADYAWSPDGKTIAYGKIGGLVFHDLASGEEQQIDFAQQIDPQANSHAAFNLAWRPDGQAVACSILFFGGRQAGGPKMIGDEEIFIIPRQGRPSWFTAQVLRDNPPHALTWVRQE